MLTRERNALVWDAVSKLPERYREVLVLYYREGASVRSVARQLGLTEDCVKKRLSRGRGMLRDQVAGIVADTLGATRPGELFTLAVLASLPVAGAQAAVAKTALASGLLTQGGSWGSKGIFSVAGAGLASGLAGALAGLTGGFFGMWMSIRNAASLQERRYVLRTGAWFYAGVWLFLGYEGLCGLLLWEQSGVLLIAAGLGWLLYMPLLYVAIMRTNTHMSRLRHASMDDDAAVDSLGVAACRRAFLFAFPVAVLGSLGLVAWLGALLPGGELFGGALLLFSHGGFAMIQLRGMRMAQNETVYLKTAPALEKEPVGFIHAETARASVANDALGLAGGLLGTSSFVYLSLASADAGVWAVALVTIHLSTVAMASYAMKRWPGARGTTTLVAMATAGAVNAVAILVHPLPWLAAFGVGQEDEALPLAARAMTAGIYLGMFLLFGVVGRVLIRARDGVPVLR